MRILVTGATGVFGRTLCERLTARGDHVVAMARRAPAAFLSGPSFVDASDGDGALQMAHPDDVGRFFAHALHTHRTGAVNLAASDVVASAETARLLGRPLVRVPSAALARGIRAGRRGEIVVPGSLPFPRVAAPAGVPLADACDVRIAAAVTRHPRRAELRRLGAALVGEATARSAVRGLDDAALGVRTSLAVDRLVQAATSAPEPVPPTRVLLARQRPDTVALPTTPAALLDRAAATVRTLLADASRRLGTTMDEVLELPCADLLERPERRGRHLSEPPVGDRARSEPAL